jgi:large-conductance mechanosensitive channel
VCAQNDADDPKRSSLWLSFALYQKRLNAYSITSSATIVVNFLIIAVALFLIIKGINRLKTPETPAAPSVPSKEVQLLTEIRDALKNR